MSESTTYLLEQRCAEALARTAGKMMLQGRREGFSIDYKSENDVVTNVDREVETYLRGELKALFPDDGLFGEEYGEEGKEQARQWLIDPIDGTLNFSQGIPMYCVSIALQVHGTTVAGVVYEPNRDELFSASLGQGTTLNGVPVQVSDRQEMRRAIMVTGFPPLKKGETFEEIATRMIQMVGSTRAVRRMGSAALDLAYVSCGRFDGFWEFGLHAWDTAAGYLLVQEAGGRVTDAHGNIFTAHEASVVATNATLHPESLATLQRLQS